MAIIKRTTELLAYQASIRNSEILSPEKEIELVELYKTGTQKEKDYAKKKILESNQLLIYRIAKVAAQSNQDQILDYVNEGNIGLIEALDSGKFDPTKGFKFITFAIHYIRREISDFRTRTSPIISVSNYNKVGVYIPKMVSDFMSTNEREPSIDELVEMFAEKGIVVNDTMDLIPLSMKSIDDSAGSDPDASTFADIPEFTSATATVNSAVIEEEKGDMKTTVTALFAVLNDNEKKVMRMFYGIGCCREYSVDDIAAEMNLTATRINQIRNKAIDKMKMKAMKK